MNNRDDEILKGLMACQATEGYVVYYNRKTIEANDQIAQLQ